MKYRQSRKLYIIAVLMLLSTANAGKIITDADVKNINVVDNQQFGFGGWNYDNVDVRIVDINDVSGQVGTFDILDGTYDPMDVNMSFESDITDQSGTVMGHLHGKDWPVGEPSGIKIINDDTKVKHSNPVNCIMTSSYQEFTDETNTSSGYLDGEDPNPVICSSPFQTHKRFKINLLPSTIEGVALGEYGKSVDLVFNLDEGDTNTTVRRYQVFQKINNYTGMRLDGYKIEVFDENGTKNPALTLSLGIEEGDTDDIWAEDEMANFSHGLWGPYDEGRFEDGFFDYKRAYYPVILSDNNQTISYIGDLQGGNYQEIFGNWVPSIWAPLGIFHDDDNDPATDGILKAFLGVAPSASTRAWYKNTINTTDPKHPVYTWSVATSDDFDNWSGDLYDQETIEDVLNSDHYRI